MTTAHKQTLRWQIDQGVAIVSYCPVCFRGETNKAHLYCAWGHGLLDDIFWFSLDKPDWTDEL